MAPENTPAAFQAAILAGADGIEFDVRLASNGVPVIIHDDTLYRTGGVGRRVADLTSAELNNVDVGSWFGPQFENERVPSLAQLFKLFRSNNLLLCLEMKCQPGEQSRLAEACYRLIDEYQLKDRMVVECFDLSALEILKAIDPALKTAALFYSASPFVVDHATAVGASVLALHYRSANRQLIEIAKAAGLNVVIWTVDDPAWINRARAMEIDGLITNDPSAFITARDAI